MLKSELYAVSFGIPSG